MIIAEPPETHKYINKVNLTPEEHFQDKRTNVLAGAQKRINLFTLQICYQCTTHPNLSGAHVFSAAFSRIIKGEAAFSPFAPVIWNKLPENCESTKTPSYL